MSDRREHRRESRRAGRHGPSQADTDTQAGLFDRWRRALDSLPGAAFVRQQAEYVEARALRHLQQRLRQVDDDQAGSSGASNTGAGKATGRRQTGARSPAGRLQQLIERSLHANPDQAEHEFHLRILDQLVPDEARILAALSDGGQIAVCHVEATSRLGTHSERILANVSRVGNEAGVILVDNVPFYLGHLADLGLIEIGPETPDNSTQYEMIETGSQVRKTCERIENEMGMKPRTSRHSAQLSELGTRLWRACQDTPG